MRAWGAARARGVYTTAVPTATAPYLAGMRSRRDRARAAAAAAGAEARALAARLAAGLAAEPGVKRVWLVGSLARSQFKLGSDIDLVVEGLPAERLFAVGAALEAEAGGFAVDLVPLESARPLFRQHVEREGVVLWSHD